MRYVTGQSIASLNARGVAIGMARQVNLDEPLTGEQAGYTIYVDRVSQWLSYTDRSRSALEPLVASCAAQPFESVLAEP